MDEPKPEKRLYPNQEEVCDFVIAKTKQILNHVKGIKEAFIFGTAVNGKGFGTYVEPWRDNCGQINTGSDVDVIVIINPNEIPLSWEYLGTQKELMIYNIGRVTIDKNIHIIEAHIPENEKKAKDIHYFISEIKTLQII